MFLGINIVCFPKIFTEYDSLRAGKETLKHTFHGPLMVLYIEWGMILIKLYEYNNTLLKIWTNSLTA